VIPPEEEGKIVAPASSIHQRGTVIGGSGEINAPSHLTGQSRTVSAPPPYTGSFQPPETPGNYEAVRKPEANDTDEETVYGGLVRRFNRYAPSTTPTSASAEEKQKIAESGDTEPGINIPKRPAQSASEELPQSVTFRSAPAKVPQADLPADEEGGMTGRLLRAKRRVYEERGKKEQETSSEPEKEQ
jgi:hypothetical protein